MIGMIWAQGHDRAIGAHGTIPWSVPEDMALFKRVTMGAPVIMGRTTWESIDAKYRPLNGRKNIVVSTNPEYNAEGATLTPNLDAAIEQATGGDDSTLVWVIGGAQIYQQLISRADGLVVTDLDIEVSDATAHAPLVEFEWELLAAEPERGWLHSKSGVNYRFSVYGKKGSHFPYIDIHQNL